MRNRGDPFDGMSGLLALWIAIAALFAAASGTRDLVPGSLAVDAFLIITGLMAARATRHSLHEFAEIPLFLFWRALRIGPSVLASIFLFLGVTSVLAQAGFADGMGYLQANGLVVILVVGFIGSLVYGIASLSGALSGAIGRAGIAAFCIACVTARVAEGFEIGLTLSPSADLIARFTAAFALGALLDSISSAGRVSRGLRRLKARYSLIVEASALVVVVIAILATPPAMAPLTPLSITAAMLLFTRRQGMIAHQVFCARQVRALGASASPMIACCFLLTWPLAEFVLVKGSLNLTTTLLLTPLFIPAAFGLAFGIRRLVEDPVRMLISRFKAELAIARQEVAAAKARAKTSA